jgi:hypothetical protein
VVVRLQKRLRSRDLESRALLRIVRGDGCAGDLEREAIRGCLSVQLAAMSRQKRSTKLLEDTALARRVFRILVDREGFVEVTPATSTILVLGPDSIWILLHVA